MKISLLKISLSAKPSKHRPELLASFSGSEEHYDLNNAKGVSVNFLDLVKTLSKPANVVIRPQGVLLFIETQNGQPLAAYDVDFKEAFAPNGKQLPPIRKSH